MLSAGTDGRHDGSFSVPSRGGYAYTLAERKRLPRLYRRVFGLPKAIAGTFIFASMLPFEMLRGRTYTAWRLLRIAVQVGHIWGWFNLRYEEYKVQGGRKTMLAHGQKHK